MRVASSMLGVTLALCLAAPAKGAPPTVQVFQTTPTLSQALTALAPLALTNTRPIGVPLITVDDTVRYQRLEGFGAAITDSSAWLIHDQLAPGRRKRLMQDLFGASGIDLSFLRVPIGASDFTTGGPYTYDDGRADPALARFSIAHDLGYVIPAIRGALGANPVLQILATPWSPPAWMKANGQLGNLGGSGTLLRSAYKQLARYIVKFIEAYAAAGVPIDAITPQNEPGVEVPYPSMNLPENDEATLVTSTLAPALHAAGLHPRIFGFDGVWATPSYAYGLASGRAAGALAGISWHCYFGNPGAMSAVHRRAPRLEQIVDECSPEVRKFSTAELTIASLRNWASAVAVWNLALDASGGPVQTPNVGCSGCTGVATVRGHDFRLSLKYFQLGQVSRFVHRGAYRIGSGHFVSYGTDRGNTMVVSSGLDDVAFVNPDGTKVLVAYDNSAKPITFAVQSDGRFFTYAIPPGATTTFMWR
jgi:glucosylceramidase